MARRARLTLVQLFVLTTVVVAVVAGAALFVLVGSSRASILQSAEVQREAEARDVDEQVTRELGVAGDTLAEVERAMRHGAVRADDPSAVEVTLFTALLDHPSLSDVTFTHASSEGFAPDGDMRLAPDDRWQVSLYRTHGGKAYTRRVSQQGGVLVADVRQRPPDGGLDSAPFTREAGATDPTRHPTFEVTASKGSYGKAIWSDLHWSERDAAIPKKQRRVVVTVQKAVEDTQGHFVGVLRVGLDTRMLDKVPVAAARGATDGRQVFLCDAQGRLVARPEPGDALEVSGDDLRVAPAHLDATIAAALASPRLREVKEGRPRSDTLDVGGRRVLVTFRALAHTQGWVVGVAVPEQAYTHALTSLRGRFLGVFGGLVVVVLLAGGFVLRALRRGLGSIVASTSRMRALDFGPQAPESAFRDVAEVQAELERAKTSMRALGKYVPLDLVRDLYESNREPKLGGELVELSMMFTDIEGFTTLSEKLAPDVLAEALGLYLAAMTEGVREQGGTVDKFVGDAVMAFWNAPHPVEDHATRACRAVVACMQKTRALYASPAWEELPPLFTRFGLHRATVMVGHFGAPDRFSYTALGDGVNLASRLEGLCKHYGVAVLASEAVMERARDEFAFRLVDRVAVKGKTEGVRVYELLGPKDAADAGAGVVEAYEKALEAYFARDFGGALRLLEPHPDDPPSGVLARRCRALLEDPPPEDWDGVYVATSK